MYQEVKNEIKHNIFSMRIWENYSIKNNKAESERNKRLEAIKLKQK